MKTYLFIFISALFFFNSINAQVLISESGGTTPDESAMLQIDSDTKGVLIPRMTTINREAISAVPGLLVYDTDEGSFYLQSNTGWVDLSSSAEIWTRSASNVYLTNPDDNIGIGTTPSTSKFVVQANSGSLADDVLFEVKDEAGNPVFRVTSEGVRIYVKEKTKGVSGGFAVGQYGSLKADGDEFFTVTPFQTSVNTLPGAKANSGGFAVGQYASLKGGTISTNFYTNPNETRVYTDPQTKGVSGGFAVGQYGSLKAPGDKYLHLTVDNTFIGNLAGLNTDGITGINNVFIGANAGQLNTTGSGNIFIGNNAGSTVVSSNKLYIDNASSSSDEALVYGDFTTKAVNLNARLRFNTGSNTITLPTYRGSNNQVLTMNGITGVTDWSTAQSLITLPAAYVPPTLFILYDKGPYFLNDDDNIGALVVKTDDGLGRMDIQLPPVKNNHGRIIVIKNFRLESPIYIYPDPELPDNIQGGKVPLDIVSGLSYTLQAEFDEKTGEGIWYVNSIYP